MIKTHSFKVGSRVLLHGLILVPEVALPAPGVILCHGLGSGLGAMYPCALGLAKKGLITLCFDFRGHGLSGGTFDGNEAEDILSVWQWLNRNQDIDRKRIALVGHSVGARAAILAAAQMTALRALAVLSCPPEPGTVYWQEKCFAHLNQMRDVTSLSEYPSGGTLPWLSGISAEVSRIWMYLRGYRLRADWNSFLACASRIPISPALAAINCPKLFVHCRGDKIAPLEAAEGYYQRAYRNKDIIISEKGYHSTPLLPGRLRQRWMTWLIDQLGPPD